jgi:hypothetical protein
VGEAEGRVGLAPAVDGAVAWLVEVGALCEGSEPQAASTATNDTAMPVFSAENMGGMVFPAVCRDKDVMNGEFEPCIYLLARKPHHLTTQSCSPMPVKRTSGRSATRYHWLDRRLLI